jgi:hypothetical protein
MRLRNECGSASLLILWGLGLVTGCTMGEGIHALPVIAIVVMLIQVTQGRRPS